MELTINTFSKGLLLDTHPMVQSNDTLSDCINGTFITMNGNEMLLQNDMGNRRVDNAFLPSGYEPVGIKEYGGIIYIAAYNPITGRSQIGSFPSPERRISKVDDNDLGATVDFNQDFRLFGKGVKVDSRYNNILWLVTDTFLYPLSSKNSMHAGDKFVVYGFHNDKSFDLNKYITNYYNTRGDKVITPLNRKYTLSLGILNSQNEFADITSTLVRWQDDIRCEFDETATDLFKFNKGYFLADGLPSNIGTFEDSINDTQFIQERKALTLAINTYAYKLIGPLYLKVVLNHIEQFNYNIYGVYDNGKGTLWVEGYLIYNCPHIVDSPNPINDEDYITFDDGALTSMQSFDFYWIDDEVQFSSGKCVQDLNFDLINTTTFDKNTSMYSAKIVKKFNISRDGGRFRMEENDEIFDFFLGVCAPEITLNNEQIYLEGLSVFDSINLSLLGSGVVKIKGWRFYNSVDERNTSLTYLLNAYPRYKRKFINLEMLLWDASLLTSVPDISAIPDALVPLSEQIFNGRTTVKFEWPSTIEPRKLYYVALRYLILNIDNPNLYYTADDVECTTPIWIQLDTQGKLPWFLSTELFNSCYIAGKEDFIACYFNPVTEEELASYNKKVAVDVIIDPGLVIPVESKQVGLTGRLIQDLKQPSVYTRRPVAGEGESTSIEEENLNSPFSIDTITDIEYLYHPTIVIKNPELYPDYLTVDPEAVNSITYSKTYYYDKMEQSTDKLDHFVYLLNLEIKYSSPPNNTPIKVIEITEANNEDRKFDFRITNRDVVYCERVSSPDIKIINAFDSIQHTLSRYLKETIKGAAALTPEFDARGGNPDGHFINFVHYEDFTKKVDDAWTKCDYARSAEFEVVNLLNKTSKVSDHITELYRQVADSEVIISFSSVELDFYDLMDTYFENLEFVFLFDYYNPEGLQGMTDSVERVSEIPQLLFSKGARVWWKTSFGKWVLLKDIYPNPMYNKKSSSDAENNVTLDFTRWLSRFFVNDFVYCFIGEIGIDKCGLAVPIKESMIYTLPYSFDITISILLQLSRHDYIVDGAADKLCKQLIDFKLDKEIKQADHHKITISSNEDFKEIVSLDFTALRNIDIVTGKTRDINNNLLSTASLYKRTDKGLEVYNSPYIEIKEATVNTNYNKVLYANLENFGNPKLRYDCDGGDGKHHWTLIDYKDVLVTPQVI